MPLFDYQCAQCGHGYEELVSSAEARPPCPKCGAADPEKLPSAFAVGRGGGAAARELPPACQGCSDPRGPGGCGMLD